jgi:hypothetical protein
MMLLPPLPAWMAAAECANTDSLAEFFPEAGGRFTEAREQCGRCPVSAECLTAAMAEEGDATGGRYGMRGGLTPEDRHRLAGTGRRRVQIAATR